MRPLITLTMLICYQLAIASPNECITSQSPLVQLLEQYSAEHETKFVIDPRVRAKVTLIGIDPEALDSGTLIGILNIHMYVALTKDDIVYVMPYQVAEAAGDKYGTLWEG